MPGGAVTLRTDISQFYGSVCTHAIDWAIRGKLNAKKHMRKKVLGSRMDKLLRDSRDGQTIGLSIGPDTSWLMAEVLLGRVDYRLCATLPKIANRAARYGDDMVVYAESQGEAAEVLGLYEHYLHDYELTLNSNKVQILDGLMAPEERWVVELRQMRYRDENDKYLAEDLLDIFSAAFEHVRAYPTSGVLAYAIMRCNPFPAGKETWPLYRDLILASISQEPRVLTHAYDVLRFAKAHGLPIDDSRLEEVLNEACRRHAKFNHGFEVSWILEILRELGLPLHVAAAKQVAEMQDNCSLLLLTDMMQGSSMLKASVDISSAMSRAESDGALSSSDWLLAYEARRNKWCRPNRWDRSLAWKELYTAHVKFFGGSRPRRRKIHRDRPHFISSWSY